MLVVGNVGHKSQQKRQQKIDSKAGESYPFLQPSVFINVATACIVPFKMSYLGYLKKEKRQQFQLCGISEQT
jgi:hypothetical protein